MSNRFCCDNKCQQGRDCPFKSSLNGRKRYEMEQQWKEIRAVSAASETSIDIYEPAPIVKRHDTASESTPITGPYKWSLWQRFINFIKGESL